MVALDNSSGTVRPVLPYLSLVSFAAAACLLIALIAIAAHGFDENGFRLGSQLAWRFTSLVYFVAIIAGPLNRLVPFAPLKYLGTRRRQLIWAFCACYGVYLASLLVPNTLAPGAVNHEGLTAGLSLFLVFGGVLVAVIAYTASPQATLRLGDMTRRAMLAVGLTYFWLCYAILGLAHLSGPHRPDAFFGVSLSLMLVALLVRFTDRLMVKRRVRASDQAPIERAATPA